MASQPYYYVSKNRIGYVSMAKIQSNDAVSYNAGMMASSRVCADW